MNFRRCGWICSLILLSSCGPSDRYWGVYDLPNDRPWRPTENVVFEFTTMAGRGDRIELFVRTLANAGNKPVRLVVRTSRADGLYWQDTVQFAPRATWGSVYETKLLLRQGVRWQAWEDISMGVRPADEPLEGVVAVGFTIDGAATKKQKKQLYY